MGDSCCAEYSIGAIKKLLERTLGPGCHVHSIATARSERLDIFSSYFGNVNNQVEMVCDELSSIPQLQNGYVGVGFSQGGQFMRAVVERCQHRGPPMAVLVTMGAQHQGVMDIPGCWEPSFNSTPSFYCRTVQRLLGWGAYMPWIQQNVVQAQYFKDPDELDLYYRQSIFLADINAEAHSGPLGVYKQYRENLASLRLLVLFQFDNDVTVVPKESAHFAFYDGERLVPLNESDLYVDDRIGLRALDEAGKLALAHAPGFHMQFELEWFEAAVIKPYLMVENTAFL